MDVVGRTQLHLAAGALDARPRPAAMPPAIQRSSSPAGQPASDVAPAVAAPRRVPTQLELKIRRSFTTGSQRVMNAGSQIKRAFSWPFASAGQAVEAEAAGPRLSVSAASSKLRDAVRRNDVAGVREAIRSGAKSSVQSFSALGRRGTTALTVAATMPTLHPDIWNALIALGGLDEPMGTHLAHSMSMPREHHGDRALHQAVRCGNLAGVSRLLEARANPMIANTAGHTPGQLAFARWKAEPGNLVNQILVGQLMPPHMFLAEVKHEVRPLPPHAIHGVVSHFSPDVLSTVSAATARELRPGLTPRQLEGVERLHRALTRGDHAAANRLISAGADRLVENAAGATAARVAFEAFARAPRDKARQRAAIGLLPVEEFLDHLEGATPPVPAEHVRSAFDLLSRQQLTDHPAHVRERLEPHLSDTQREISRHGDTELHSLVRSGRIDRLLQLRGSPQADMTVRNRDGMSASTLALELLRQSPTDRLRQQMVIEMVWADEIVDMIEKPGGPGPDDPLRSVIHAIPRMRLAMLQPASLEKAWPHLSPEQQRWPGLKEQDTDLHLAVRQGDLQTMLKRELQAYRVFVNGKEKMTPGQLALSLLVDKPHDAALQQAVVELLPLPELAHRIGASGLPPETLGAVVARVRRDPLLSLSAEQRSPLMPHLTAEQTQMLREGDTELHLAARSGSPDDVRRRLQIDGTMRLNTQGQSPIQVAFERFRARPDDAGARDVLAALTWLPQMMDLVEQAGGFTNEQVTRLVQRSPTSTLRPLTSNDLNRFGWMLSPEQLRQAIDQNPEAGSWIRSLGLEQFNRFSTEQLEALRPAVNDWQLQALTPPPYVADPPAYQQLP